MIIKFSTLRLLLVIGLFLSPSGYASDQAAKQALETAQAFIAALTSRDGQAAVALLGEDAVLEMPYPLAEGENKYGSRKMWGEPLHNYVLGIVERNSQIAFNNSVWRTTHDGLVLLESDGDLVRSKDGKRYQNKYLIIFRAEEGKITLWREYFNPVTAARTFGIPLESLP